MVRRQFNCVWYRATPPKSTKIGQESKSDQRKGDKMHKTKMRKLCVVLKMGYRIPKCKEEEVSADTPDNISITHKARSFIHLPVFHPLPSLRHSSSRTRTNKILLVRASSPGDGVKGLRHSHYYAFSLNNFSLFLMRESCPTLFCSVLLGSVRR